MSANSLPMLWADGTSALCNHLWQSTLFAGVVWLLALVLRRYRARTRYWLWMAASVKFLVPFSLLAVVVSHLKWLTHAGESQTATFIAVHQMSQPFTEVAGLSAPILSMAAPLPASHFPPVVLLLAAVWLLGFIAVLAFWLVQWRRVSRSVRTVMRLRDGREVEALRRMERMAGLRRPMEIVPSPGSMEPGVFGVLRPVLLWPEGISRHLDEAHLEAVLAHEVCHVRWRDNLTSMVHMLVSAVFWFHPLVWWMEKQLVKERELACDEEVVSLCNQPQVYAESILKVCEFCIESPLTCVSGITGADLKKRVKQIMTGKIGVKMSLGRKLLLIAIGFVAIAVPVAFGVVPKIPMFGQLLHPSDPMPSFEVATIKPSQGAPPPGSDRSSPPDEVELYGQAKLLIGYAYKLPPFSKTQIVGGPAWIDTEIYEVHAKIEASQYAAMQKMSPAQRQDQQGLMMQSLLADRFRLKVHFETRELPVYSLVVAKGGLKLTPVEDVPIPFPPPPRRPGPPDNLKGVHNGILVQPKGKGLEMIGKGLTLDQIAQILHIQPEIGGRLIENKTGLSGAYDCKMQWTRESMTPESDNASSQDGDMPSYFTAIQEQLGLKLVPTKGKVEVVVIDHIEQPSAN